MRRVVLLLEYFHFLNWSFEALAARTHKTTRWDVDPLRDDEINLKAKKGSPCPRAAIIFVKADLAEYGGCFWVLVSSFEALSLLLVRSEIG